ncbi:MAG: alpha/beta hydrolase [Solirubrobacterales bacterium]|nr:alpha/beta hydrolase [Solirubrobacterales bacterium]
MGEGQPLVLLHGISATRRYVVHGSKLLPRSGRRTIAYDARGHGESDPAPADQGYSYAELAQDLGRVIEGSCDRPPVLVGHSMGCHTVAAFALEHPDEVAGAVLISPASLGLPAAEEVLAHWDRLADGLDSGGVDGFMKAYEPDITTAPEWRETVLRLTRERIGLHSHPEALSWALREVPRSLPFEGISELESLRAPSLVVASHDDADPNHPFAVAEAWAEALPGATLVSEAQGESPLAWQGGRLSREIVSFCERTAV